ETVSGTAGSGTVGAADRFSASRPTWRNMSYERRPPSKPTWRNTTDGSRSPLANGVSVSAETSDVGTGAAATPGLTIDRTTVKQPRAARQNSASQTSRGIHELGCLDSGNIASVRRFPQLFYKPRAKDTKGPLSSSAAPPRLLPTGNCAPRPAAYRSVSEAWRFIAGAAIRWASSRPGGCHPTQ